MFIEFELDSLVEDRRPYALDNKILKAVFECCDPHLKCLGVIYNTKLVPKIVFLILFRYADSTDCYISEFEAT